MNFPLRIVVKLALPMAFCISGCAIAQAQNLLTNGSFELPGFTVGPNFRYLTNGSTIISGWTATDDGIGEMPYWTQKGPSVPYVSYDGIYAVTLNQGASLATTFSTIAGKSYDVSIWAYTGMTQYPSGYAPLMINAGGSSSSFFPVFSGIQSFSFVAASTNANAVFSIVNNSSVGDYKAYIVDAASVTLSPVSSSVPEPGSIALLVGLGGAGLSLAFRRRHSKVA